MFAHHDCSARLRCLFFVEMAGVAASPGIAPRPPVSESRLRARRYGGPSRRTVAYATRPTVALRAPRIKSPLHHFNACRPKWCSRQDSHLHWRRSRRRASALGYASKMIAHVTVADGHEDGALTRSCTELIRLPSERIADNALRAIRIGVPDGTVHVLRALSLPWTTWAKWCRVREFHPQPLRSKRSASGSWANAALKLVHPAGLSPANSPFEAEDDHNFTTDAQMACRAEARSANVDA